MRAEVFPRADRTADEHPGIEAPLGNDEPLRSRSLLIGSPDPGEPIKSPYLLPKLAIPTGPNGSENRWQNPKRLAVRLAEDHPQKDRLFPSRDQQFHAAGTAAVSCVP